MLLNKFWDVLIGKYCNHTIRFSEYIILNISKIVVFQSVFLFILHVCVNKYALKTAVFHPLKKKSLYSFKILVYKRTQRKSNTLFFYL